MEVLILTVFVSVILGIGELVFFAWNVHTGSHDHSERLSLLPLDQDLRASVKDVCVGDRSINERKA